MNETLTMIYIITNIPCQTLGVTNLMNITYYFYPHNSHAISRSITVLLFQVSGLSLSKLLLFYGISLYKKQISSLKLFLSCQCFVNSRYNILFIKMCKNKVKDKHLNLLDGFPEWRVSLSNALKAVQIINSKKLCCYGSKENEHTKPGVIQLNAVDKQNIRKATQRSFWVCIIYA